MTGANLGFRGITSGHPRPYCKACDQANSAMNAPIRKAIQEWEDADAKYGQHSFASGRAAEALAQLSHGRWFDEATKRWNEG
jgi:hypothetical protein